jgi:hypothetical protein
MTCKRCNGTGRIERIGDGSLYSQMSNQTDPCPTCRGVYESEKTYGDGFGAGYAQAIGDADAALKSRGDDFAIRHCRQSVLALVAVQFDPDHAAPRPDWTHYRVPAVRDYPKSR